MERMTTHNWGGEGGREEIPSLTKISTNLVSHFLLGEKANISCFPKDSDSEEHLSSQPESCQIGSKLGQKNLQSINSRLLPTLNSIYCHSTLNFQINVNSHL